MSPRLATRLATPDIGWTTQADVIVVGSGIAGLTAALRLRRRVPRVLLVTKTVLDSGSTRWPGPGCATWMRCAPWSPKVRNGCANSSPWVRIST